MNKPEEAKYELYFIRKFTVRSDKKEFINYIYNLSKTLNTYLEVIESNSLLFSGVLYFESSWTIEEVNIVIESIYNPDSLEVIKRE